MIAKTPTGVTFFDETFGGTYAGRVMLVTGKSGAGKSILSLQFLDQGLKLNERCLLLSARPADDVALYAAAYGISVDQAIEAGNLIILEYSDYVPGRDREDQLKLPPDSFIQLKQIIEEQAVQRVVLDTILPWVAIRDQDRLPEHVFSFVRVFHRLGTTSLFTLPKPASTAAYRLRKLLEDVVPVSVALVQDEADHQLKWYVSKYLGADVSPGGVPYEAKPKQGIVRKTARPSLAHAPGRETRPSFVPVETFAAEPKTNPALPSPVKTEKPSFSDLILQKSAAPEPAHKPSAPNAVSKKSQPLSDSSGWNSVPAVGPS